jgi:hypothetical protein
MPSLCYSTTVLLLLELSDSDGRTAWDSCRVLERLGLKSRPRKNMPAEEIPDGLTASSCAALAIFLDSVQNHTLADRGDFIEKGSDCSRGRQVWREWFRTHITKKLNCFVESQLTDLGHNPLVILAEGSVGVWPSPHVHVGACASSVAYEIFGSTIEDGNGIVREDAYGYAKTMLLMTFVRLKKQWERATKKLPALKEKAKEAMKSKSILMFLAQKIMLDRRSAELDAKAELRLSDIRTAQGSLDSFKSAARWFPEEKAEAEEMTGFFEGVWTSMGKEVERPSALILTKDKAERGKCLRTLDEHASITVFLQ